MQGRFDVTLFDAGRKKDDFFEEAIRAGTLDEVLGKMRVEQKCEGVNNRIFDNMSGYVLDKLLGLGNAGWPYYLAVNGAPPAALAFICLTDDATDTTSYEEDWGAENNSAYDNINKMPGTVSPTTAAKRFEEDQVTGWVIWSDPAREAIHFRNRWLYTPSQAISSVIRSVGIFFHEDGDGVGSYYTAKGKIGRVRLKDSAGALVTLNKSASQVLLVEYTFTLAAM